MAKTLLESMDTKGDLSHSRLWQIVMNKMGHDLNQLKTNLKRVIRTVEELRLFLRDLKENTHGPTNYEVALEMYFQAMHNPGIKYIFGMDSECTDVHEW